MTTNQFCKLISVSIVAFTFALPSQGQTTPADSDRLPAGSGKQLVLTACTQCHSLERIYTSPRSPEQWKEVMKTMVANGAELGEEAAEQVTAYLAKSFGPTNFPATQGPSPTAENQRMLRPVANVYQLMKAIIIPASDAVWQVNMEAPQDEEQWAALRNSAIALAESGNLLMIGSRAKDQDNWVKYSQSLIDWSTIILRAAEAKNVTAVNEAGDELVGVCSSCHRQYKQSLPR